MKHRFLILIIWLLASVGAGATDEYSFRSYMSADGLSDNSVLCGMRDRYGFMWFGTTNGLNCFDGTTNTVYRDFSFSGSGLYGSDVVYSLLELGDNIYVGGNAGIKVLNRVDGTFRTFAVATRFGVVVSSLVHHLFCARNGLVWICTLGQGVFVYNPAAQTLVQNSLHGGFASSATQTADGMVCIAMLDGSVAAFSPDGNYITSYPIPQYKNEKNNITIKAQGNNLWLGTDAGLYFIDRSTRQVSAFSTPLPGGAISAMLVRGPHSLLLGTKRGVFGFDTSTHAYSRVDGPGGVQGLTDQTVNDLLIDRDGTLWVLTNMGGVNYMPRQEAKFRRQSLPADPAFGKLYVYAFAPVGNGDAWVGSTNGLYYYNHATGTTTPYRGGMIQSTVRTLLLDGRRLWVGTALEGLKIIDLPTGEVKSYIYSENKPYTIPCNEIRHIYKTSNGTVYLATSWSLCRFDMRTERFYSFAHFPTMTDFVDLVEDRKGQLWVATNGYGIYRMDIRTSASRFYSFDHRNPHSLPSNAITALACDRRGRLFVGTKDGGLCVYNPDINGFDRVPGVDDNVNAVCTDRQGNVWVATEKRLIKILHGDVGSLVHVNSPADMWRGNLMPRASALTADGNILIGSANGFYSFRPSTIKDAVAAPVYITSISFPYATNSKDELKSLGLDRALYINNNVRLPYRDNSFTIHFASPRFSSAQSVRYDYMLCGVDKQWAHSTGYSEATYANVEPGKYEFLLREAGTEGPVSRLVITVLPPWWRTPWAYLLYILAAATLCWLAYRRAKRMIRRRYDKHLERFRVEQEKKMFESKINFFVNLVHEIRTPLSLIVLPLERLAKSTKGSADYKYITVIRQNMNYLLSITNQLLDFQKVEDGKYQIHKQNTSMREVVTAAYERFASYCEIEHKQLHLELPEGDVTTAVDRSAVNKIVMNLMSNALKYARTTITIGMRPTADGGVSIYVMDDGKGVPDSEKPHVFDSFYQVSGDNVARMIGSGIGLAFSRTLATAHGGDMAVTDAPGGGSCFTLTLPVTLIDESDASPDTNAQMVIPADLNVEANPATKSFTVLLVEDNAQLLEMTADVMHDWYRVLRARNGAEALNVMKHEEVDIVVSDVMMPVMDGTTLCSKIKGDMELSHIPVVLLTAKTTVEAKVEGLRSGADAYIEKPFSIDQLHLQIENLFRLRQQFHKRMGAAEGGVVEPTAASDFGINQQNMAFLQKVQDLFDANMADPNFSIDGLASDVNMSRSSFYRKLKSLTGMTPVDYMKSQRMKRAARLLIEGLSVSDVAQQTGIASASYFTKCFKQAYGVLPKDYVAKKLSGEE